MAIKYYAFTPDSRKNPTVLYRFFDDKNRMPEMYRKDEGWVPSDLLWPMLSSGELTQDDLVTEEEAEKIVKSLGGSL
jgi:hypothetical protein